MEPLTTGHASAVFEDTVGLRVRIGEREFSASCFYAWPSRTWLGAVPSYDELGPVPSDTSAEYPKHVRQFVARLFLEQRYGTPLRKAPAEALDPGFYCLVLNFPVPSTFVQEHTALVVSYRQPLVCADGEGHLLTCPYSTTSPRTLQQRTPICIRSQWQQKTGYSNAQ